MRLIGSKEDSEARMRVEIYEMDASGYTVFVTRGEDRDSKESYVFDSESDAATFADRQIKEAR